MPGSDDPDPFESTEEYYAKYRPDYGEATVEYLVEQFDLDNSARVLDLGCGAAQLAVPLAAHAGEVVGMDPNERMLREARGRAEDAGRENVEWVVGSDADLSDELGTFRLTTMGRSFHWMEGRRTLDRLHSLTDPGGGVALLTDREWLTKGTHEWQAEVYEIVGEYVADLPERVDPTEVEYEDSWSDMLRESKFVDVEEVVVEFEREWDVESIVGYVLSLSFTSPAVFGDEQDAFEADLRARLAEMGEEPFVQDVTVEVLTARKATDAQ